MSRSRVNPWHAALALGLGGAIVCTPAESQVGGGALRVSLGVEPARVTVGDPFHAAVQVVAPTGFSVEYLDFAGSDSLEAVAAVEVTRSETGASVGVYALVAWIAGEALAANVPVRVVGPDGTARVQEVSLRLPEVLSVLPENDEGVEPRPPKDLLVPSLTIASPWWWWLALALLLLAALLGWWLLRRRSKDDAGELLDDPREWALAQLTAIGGGVGSAAPEEVFRRVSWVLRTYVWRVTPGFGRELTTTELLRTMQLRGESPAAVEPLAGMLAECDLVKFAGSHPSPADAERLLRQGALWVTGYPAPADEAAGELPGRVA